MPHKLPGSTVGHSSDSWTSCYRQLSEGLYNGWRRLLP